MSELPENIERLVRIESLAKDNKEKLHKIEGAILGNGKDGIIVRLDRVEQTEEKRKWAFRALAGGVIALVGEMIMGWVKK